MDWQGMERDAMATVQSEFGILVLAHDNLLQLLSEGSKMDDRTRVWRIETVKRRLETAKDIDKKVERIERKIRGDMLQLNARLRKTGQQPVILLKESENALINIKRAKSKLTQAIKLLKKASSRTKKGKWPVAFSLVKSASVETGSVLYNLRLIARAVNDIRRLR